MEIISDLYSYPVTITSDDVNNYLGIVLANELIGDTNVKIREFLDTVHRHIYDFLIYVTGDRDLKNKIITTYSNELTKPIKRALLTQAQYLLNGGNIEIYNGVVKSVNGVDYKDINETVSKVLAPSIINILSSTKPNILYAGE